MSSGFNPMFDKYGKASGSAYENPRMPQNPCKSVDTHEMLKRELISQMSTPDIEYRSHVAMSSRPTGRDLKPPLDVARF